jgi:hypothetical protein
MKEKIHFPQPDYTLCPKHHCFHWLEKGSLIARHVQVNLDEVSTHWEKVKKSGCGCSFGNCVREGRFKDLDTRYFRDWYEPCEPSLEKEGVPHDYFINPKK